MRPALAGIDAVSAELSDGAAGRRASTPSFHATLPAAAAGYALPFEWSERWGLKRFGFHGLSVQYSVEQARACSAGRRAKLIVCHLGSGCSITAVADGKSLDTTMGFSPLDGVMMATRVGLGRSGALACTCKRAAASASTSCGTRSPIARASSASPACRAICARSSPPPTQASPRARLAYERFIWTLRRAVGAMAGVLGGVDALVFTGGIGENSARVRGDVAAALAFAGLRLRADASGTGDRRDLRGRLRVVGAARPGARGSRDPRRSFAPDERAPVAFVRTSMSLGRAGAYARRMKECRRWRT